MPSLSSEIRAYAATFMSSSLVESSPSTGSPTPRRPRGKTAPAARRSGQSQPSISAACSHAVAQAIQDAERVADEYSADRSSTTSGAERSGPVSWARRTCRAGRRRRAGGARGRRVAPVLEQRVPLRAQRAYRLLAQRLRGATPPPTARWGCRPPHRRRGAPHPVPRARGAPGSSWADRWPTAPELRAPAPRRLRPRRLAVGSGVERVQPDGTTGAQRHRPGHPRHRQVGVLARTGSTTQARRPKTAWRHKKVLTKALLPRPI